MKKGTSSLGLAKARPLLLDVNVLLALAWPNHQFHTAARQRLETSEAPWATCALTQLGFIRLSSNPSVVGAAKSPKEAASLLGLLVEDSRHLYLGSLPAPVAESSRQLLERILGYKQVTDAYLLTLAEGSNATLLTFDTRLDALAQAPESVEVLGV